MIHNDTEREDALRRHHEGLTTRILERACGWGVQSVQPGADDRLRAAVADALHYLGSANQPAAEAVLRRALKL